MSAELFDQVEQRSARPEKPAIYAAIMRARRKGYRVRRISGSQHLLGNKWGHARLVSSIQLKRLFPGGAEPVLSTSKSGQ